jgi:topoisomerase-4 subunit B
MMSVGAPCGRNSGLRFAYNGQTVVSEGGLLDLLAEEIGDESMNYEIAHYRGPRLEFAFTHTANYGENYFSFVNGQFTIDGGTHQTAFRLGVLKAIDEYAGVNFAAEDVREGMIGAVSIKVIGGFMASSAAPMPGSDHIRCLSHPYAEFGNPPTTSWVRYPRPTAIPHSLL